MINSKFRKQLEAWFQSLKNEFLKVLKWSLKNQAAALRQIRTMRTNGVDLNDVGLILSEHGNYKTKQIGLSIISLSDGFTLSSALRPHLSRVAYESLVAGEKSGNEIAGLDNAINNLELNTVTSRGVFWTIAKRMIGIIALTFGFAGFSTLFAPVLSEQLPYEKWPNLASGVYSLGLFFSDYGVSFWILLSIFFLVLIASMPVWIGEMRSKIDTSPIVYRQYRLFISTSMLLSLTNLLKAGVSLKESLLTLKNSGSPYLAKHIEKMLERLQSKGKGNLGVILDTGLLLPDQIHVIRSLSEVADSGKIVESSSAIHQEKLISEMKLIETVASGALLIVFYCGVFCLVGSVVVLATEIAMNIRMYR